jgi:HPt (histidine-containing phosphotransfer) domain-containing protein
MAQEKSAIPVVQSFGDHQVITQPNPLRQVLRRVSDTDSDDPVARAEKALDALSGEFNDWMLVECERLAGAHAAIVKNGFSTAARQELFRAAHDIKGSAATFGYPTAGVAADSLCRVIEHAPDLDKVPGDLIVHHINAIVAIVRENNDNGKSAMANELSGRLRVVTDEFLASANRDRPEHLEAVLTPSIVPGN